ncbi:MULTISPECIES: ABC transporter ATP-binding protein [Halomonas]|uniref:ABC transporter ATP-binding protein n=2 Tax=Halomonadaceae TaxID=28256 RepID=UPI001865AA07|nr:MULTISPECIES: ABC transporter ATP-binding protein [Halomonas]
MTVDPDQTSIAAAGLDLAYQTKTIVHDVGLSIAKGTVTTLVGPNGSGKSTLLKGLGRLLDPLGGQVLLNGRDIREMRTRDIARRLSILPQGPVVPEGLNVHELVAYGRAPHQGLFGLTTEEDRAAVEHAMAMTGVAPWRDTLVDALSGGQRQRVWIAMTVAQQTQIMFLDEPTTYLDIAHQLDVLELLRKLNRAHGRTIVMVLHDLNLAARYSDRIVALRDGRIVADGAPRDVITPSILHRVFEIEAEIHDDPVSGCPWFVPRQIVPAQNAEEQIVMERSVPQSITSG